VDDPSYWPVATHPFVVENFNASEVREIASLVQHIGLQTVSINFSGLEKLEINREKYKNEMYLYTVLC